MDCPRSTFQYYYTASVQKNKQNRGFTAIEVVFSNNFLSTTELGSSLKNTDSQRTFVWIHEIKDSTNATP
jgi:hypothetical protein